MSIIGSPNTQTPSFKDTSASVSLNPLEALRHLAQLRFYRLSKDNAEDRQASLRIESSGCFHISFISLVTKKS